MRNIEYWKGAAVVYKARYIKKSVCFCFHPLHQSSLFTVHCSIKMTLMMWFKWFCHRSNSIKWHLLCLMPERSFIERNKNNVFFLFFANWHSTTTNTPQACYGLLIHWNKMIFPQNDTQKHKITASQRTMPLAWRFYDYFHLLYTKTPAFEFKSLISSDWNQLIPFQRNATLLANYLSALTGTKNKRFKHVQK